MTGDTRVQEVVQLVGSIDIITVQNIYTKLLNTIQPLSAEISFNIILAVRTRTFAIIKTKHYTYRQM